MLSARIVLAMVAVSTSSCQRLSPEEQRVVGTWEFSGIDFTNRVVYRNDHSAEELYPRETGLLAKIRPWATLSRGTWRLEGDTIVSEREVVVDGPVRGEKRVIRSRILEFHPDELVRDEGRSPLIRVR